MRRRHPNARWMPAEMLHLTLVFMGATDPARVPAILGAVADVVAAYSPFDVGTGGAGGRPDDRRAGVAWLSLAVGREPVARLSRELDRAIGSGVYDRATPRPHLTVARRVDQAVLDDLRRTSRQLELEWPVTAVVLFRSHTGPHGSRYEELARWALTPPNSSA